MQNNNIAIVWLTTNLRIEDNYVLHTAAQQHDHVVACYHLEGLHQKKTAFGFLKIGAHRLRFLLETLQDLQRNLNALNIPLFFSETESFKSLPKLCKKLDANVIYVQKEFTSEEQRTISKVKQELPSHIEIIDVYDQFLYHPEDVPFCFSETPNVFTNFRKEIEKKCMVRPPSHPKAVKRIPLETQTILPSLKELGYEEPLYNPNTAFPFSGGESNAIERLHHYFFETKQLGIYKKTRNGLLGSNYSSKFSPWLANGSLSAKTIYWNIKTYEKEFGANDSTYWLIFELLWRDFFKYTALKNGSSLFKRNGILNRHYTWNTEKKPLDQWINGTTREPFVNANMIELQHTGWMSNRGRQNVASFFTKVLQLDWRIGAEYFESQLLDYDVHSNYGNWQYVAGVGNDPRHRSFNIQMQARKYDPNCRYQKTWLQTTLFK